MVYAEYLELGRLQFFKAANDPEPHAFAFQHVTAEFHLRYIAACFYDEVLRVRSKLTALGRSSAIARVIVVRSQGDGALPWTDAQRERLAPLVVAPNEAARP